MWADARMVITHSTATTSPWRGEVGPRQRARRGWQRFNMCCTAATPPRTAFGSPTLPQPKPRIRGFRPLNKVIEIGNSRFRLGRVAKCDCFEHKDGDAKEGKP